MRVIETWEGESPTRGVVRVELVGRDDGGFGYRYEFPASCLGEQAAQFAGGLLTVTIYGFVNAVQARRHAITLGNACPDVPKWRRIAVERAAEDSDFAVALAYGCPPIETFDLEIEPAADR